MNANHQYIIQHVGTEEILCQLAEECMELAQAALKLRRCISGKNPTPVSSQQAAHNIVEEYADVVTCLNLISINVHQGQVQRIMEEKTARWVKRLEEADKI